MESVRTFFVLLGSQLESSVRHLVQYHVPNKDGVTLAETQLKFRAQKEERGVSKEELDEQFKDLEPPALMAEGFSLMQTFLDLSSSRPQGMNGPLPLPFTEIKAYIELMQVDLLPWEIEMLRRMDRWLLDELNSRTPKE